VTDLPTDQPSRRMWPWALLLTCALVGGYLLLSRDSRGEAKTTSASTGKGGGGARAVPVVAAAARAGDMRVDLTALGTATALNTVTVRSRVDGQLLRVLFTEGQQVKQGDLLAEIDPRPFEVQLAQAEGQAAKDQATLENARLDLDRYQTLSNGGLVPKQQVDTQSAAIRQSDGAIKSDEAQIASARLNLIYTKITAPISGRIGLRLVDVGNMVHASEQTGLLVITQIDPIAVVFTIPEDSLQPVLRRMRGATLPVEAYDRDMKTKLASGTLLTVDNQIDQTTGTVKLKAIFPNRESTLFPNQFVNVRLLVDTLRDAVIVPSAAVQHSPEGTFVYVVTKDNTVAMKDVQVRLSEAEETAVTGVGPGDVVVTDGVDKLRQGSKVTLQKAESGKKRGEKSEKGDKAGSAEKPEKTDKADKASAAGTADKSESAAKGEAGAKKATAQ
jgi:multidrug efflux system membrane fusion protein